MSAPTSADLVERIQEATQKANTLDESVRDAWYESEQARGQYEWLIARSRIAWQEVEQAKRELEWAVRLEAEELLRAKGSDDRSA